MTMKEVLGQRIKEERESKQISQKLLCGNGAALTVRQLQRIEHGQSCRRWKNWSLSPGAWI